MSTVEDKNKAIVRESFDALFNRRDFAAAERFWSPDYVQHNAHFAPGRKGLFDLVKSLPAGPVLATAGNSEAITATVDGLAPRGELVVIGADTAPLGVNPAQLLMGAYIVRGHPAGTSQDVEDTMAFSALHGIRPITEAVPLDRTDEAYQKMLAGKARFRMVLTAG
jgi:D-arabinose 1-dehydrogenase-like Zn-dependent alcohol dehydrogenase